MEVIPTATNGQTRALITALQILNRKLQDPDELDKALQEIKEAINEEKNATVADQATR